MDRALARRRRHRRHRARAPGAHARADAPRGVPAARRGRPGRAGGRTWRPPSLPAPPAGWWRPRARSSTRPVPTAQPRLGRRPSACASRPGSCPGAPERDRRGGIIGPRCSTPGKRACWRPRGWWCSPSPSSWCWSRPTARRAVTAAASTTRPAQRATPPPRPRRTYRVRPGDTPGRDRRPHPRVHRAPAGAQPEHRPAGPGSRSAPEAAPVSRPGPLRRAAPILALAAPPWPARAPRPPVAAAAADHRTPGRPGRVRQRARSCSPATRTPHARWPAPPS